MALAYFKLAIIAAGIQFRDRMGAERRHCADESATRSARPSRP